MKEITPSPSHQQPRAPSRARSSPLNGNGHDLDTTLAGFDQNDLGNAQRLISRYGEKLRYVVNVGWHAWDGMRWARDDGAVAVRRFAHSTAKAIISETAYVGDREAAKNRAKWAISSGYSPRLNGMLSQAEPHLALTADDLDTDPWLFNASNGTVDLRTGQLHPHNPANLITKLAPIEYDPDAQCVIWERFVSEIFANDNDLVAFTQRALGYSLTGITREHVIFICHGSGSNGKSVLLETVASILADYTRQCPSDTFAAKDKTGGMSNDIARLAGARLVSVVETDQERRLAEGLVKQASGGDRMAARYLNHEFFEFTPKFKLWLATNHKPRIRGTDHGIWRRIRLLPFLVTFQDPDKAMPGAPTKDDQLKETLQAELPGILAWMVRGCLDWQDIGLRPPAAVDQATTEYREQQDIVLGFLTDCCDLHQNYSCLVAHLYDAYKRWCAVNGDQPVSGKAFGECLDEKGYNARRGAHGARSRQGITLNDKWAIRQDD
jgi:putative DNA primase/helicase